jgi:hypothetical protein
MAMHHINIGKDEQGAQAYNVCENGEPARVRLHRKGTFKVDHEATILATDQWHEFMYSPGGALGEALRRARLRRARANPAHAAERDLLRRQARR